MVMRNFGLRQGPAAALLRALAIAGAAALLAAAVASSAASRHKLYFFNPESNINNFSSLKSEFDAYLAPLGDYEFQPFSSRETFEHLLAQDAGAVLLLSGWHFERLRAHHAMKPVLVGSMDGKATQRRGLFVGRAVGGLDALKGQRIASAGNRDFTHSVLRQILEPQGAAPVLDSVKIIPVPKDIDALMAVAMGLAGAAVAADGSYERLKDLNPKHYQTLRRLGESEEMLRVIVAVREPAGETAALVKAMERMTTAPQGEYALQMIGINGWQRYDAGCCGRARPK